MPNKEQDTPKGTKSTNKYKTIPVQVKYNDRIEATRKMLEIFSALQVKLTKRNIDLLTVCILEGINSKDFRQIVLDSNLGFKSPKHITMELSRLKEKGLVYDDPVKNEKHLSGGVKKIASVVNSNVTKFAYYIVFDEKS